MNEELVKQIATANHEAWRSQPSHAKSRFNVPFEKLPEEVREERLGEVRATLLAYDRVNRPAEAASEEPKRRPLPPTGPLAALEKVIKKAPAKPQDEPEEPTQTAPSMPSDERVPAHVDRIGENLILIANELKNLSEVERRSLAVLSIQSLAFNATGGDFLLATGLTERAKNELPTFFGGVLSKTEAKA